MVAAAAPNRRIIGGAGTWVPPVDDEVPPEELELLLELVEDALDEALEPLLPVDPLEPKLEEPPVAPELVELEPLLADDEALLPDEAELPLLPEEPEEPELPEDPEEPLLPELPLEL